MLAHFAARFIDVGLPRWLTTGHLPRMIAACFRVSDKTSLNGLACH